MRADFGEKNFIGKDKKKGAVARTAPFFNTCGKDEVECAPAKDKSQLAGTVLVILLKMKSVLTK